MTVCEHCILKSGLINRLCSLDILLLVKTLIFTLAFAVSASISGDISASESDLKSALKHKGNLLRMQGDYEGASRVQKNLVESYPDDPIGYVFNLNTMAARLSWDRTQTIFDEAIERDAGKTLSLCREAMDQNPDDYSGYYYCGQAHFSLTYLHAVRGNYYRAGYNGNLTIKLLEKSLELNPELVDSKMHLGMAYYYADNLPSYLKVLSRFLWFIPTGASDKSIPYLDQATREGEFFKDVAKYAYVDMLMEQDEAGREKATLLLSELARDYPQNPRFQLRLISLLLDRGLFRQTLDAAGTFLSVWDQNPQSVSDVALVKLWITRTHMALNDITSAKQTFDEIEYQPDAADWSPAWSAAWYILTNAQLLDLQNSRIKAKQQYKHVLSLRRSGSVHPLVLNAAEQGMKTPYTTLAVN